MNKLAEIRKRLHDSSNLIERTIPLGRDVARTADVIAQAYRNGRKVVLFGNGGSASEAQHMAAELIGRFRFNRPPLPALALVSNPAVLTAIANDFDYASVFERTVEGLVQEGDVVLAISTGGESVNVIKGALAARKKGATVIGLCGSKGRLASLCDIALAVQSNDTPRVQEVHMTLCHIICEIVEEELFGERSTRKGRSIP